MSVIGRRHGEPPCVCTDAGEDPQCPIHGYEAVIRRLREENERLTDDHQGAVAALVRLANPTHRPRSEEAALLQAEVVQIAQATLDALGVVEVVPSTDTPGAIEALRPYLRHTGDCTGDYSAGEFHCVCGLAAMLDRLAGGQ